jgi:hypothetical protein
MASESETLVVTKSQQDIFERGFKAWCENTSESVRKRLGLDSGAPLPPRLLAEHYGVTVWTPQQVPGLAQVSIDYLGSPEGDEWSAVTVLVDSQTFIVINSSHSPARQSSDIMHELAHIIRGHKPDQVYIQDSIALRDFDDLQEAEANWLAGALLLPRAAMVKCIRERLDKFKAMEIYGVSQQLYTYRLNKTGVNRQFK